MEKALTGNTLVELGKLYGWGVAIVAIVLLAILALAIIKTLVSVIKANTQVMTELKCVIEGLARGQSKQNESIERLANLLLCFCYQQGSTPPNAATIMGLQQTNEHSNEE